MQLSALILSLLFIPSTFAQERVSVERVPDQGSLTLLGRGLRMDDPEASIALTCAGAPATETSPLRKCDWLRWVVFVRADEAYFLGPAFAPGKIEGALNANGLPTGKFKRKLKHELGKMHYYARKSSRRVLLSAAIVTGAVMTLAIIASSGTVAPFVFTTGFGGAWAFLLLTDLYSYAATPQLILMPDQTRQIRSQKGWNWASDPKKVPSQYFQSMFRMIARTALTGQKPGEQAVDVLSQGPTSVDARQIQELILRLKATPKYLPHDAYQ